MNVIVILLAAVVVGATGLVIGLLLGVAAEKFKVEVDERESLIREALPGNNCGGCGYAGCDALAKAILNEEALITACPVGGQEMIQQISKIVGVEVASEEIVKEVAFVKCAGTCEKVTLKYQYYGEKDCKAAMLAPGKGAKACEYGCMGLGSCVKACPFDAMHIIDGVAVVDTIKCVACGKCIRSCPKQLIELIPEDSEYLVHCSSKDKGKEVKQKCSVGCIGCGLCKKVCEYDAISVVHNIAYIDQDKCEKCGKCAEKCPVKIIGNKM